MIGQGTKVYKCWLSNINPKAIIGKNCKIHSHAVIFYEVKIGDNVKIECFAFIPNLVTIEDDVFIAPGACFANDKYPVSSLLEGPWIKKGARIGVNVTILPGVMIGEKAVVGAGSVVTKDVEPGVVVVGNPACVVGRVDEIYKKAAFYTPRRSGAKVKK